MGVFLDVLFVIGLVAACLTTVFGLPGNFIVLGGAVAYMLGTGGADFGWGLIVLLAGLAGLGELLEFLFGTFTSVRYGGSRWSALGSVVGGVLGAVVGTGVLPVVGTLVGAFVGAFLLAFLFEMAHRRGEGEPLRVGFGALVGKILGLSAKMSLGLAMVVLVAVRVL